MQRHSLLTYVVLACFAQLLCGICLLFPFASLAAPGIDLAPVAGKLDTLEATKIPPSSTSIPANIPTIAPTPCTITFTDVPPDQTFYTYIQCLACKGIISGYLDGSFRPNNEITRGQIAKVVSNAAGFNEDPGSQVYEDVPPIIPSTPSSIV